MNRRCMRWLCEAAKDVAAEDECWDETNAFGIARWTVHVGPDGVAYTSCTLGHEVYDGVTIGLYHGPVRLDELPDHAEVQP